MKEFNEVQRHINQIRQEGTRQKIIGKNLLVSNLLEYLCSKNEYTKLPLLFTRAGLLLACPVPSPLAGLTGYVLPQNLISQVFPQGIHTVSCTENYHLTSPSDFYSHVQLQDLAEELQVLFQIFKDGISHEKYVLDSLDMVDNAISIYDKDAHLIYANKHYCESMNILDRDASLGKSIDDILNESKIQVHAMEMNRSYLKIKEVIRDGVAAVDWEVRIDHLKDSKKPYFMTYDIYPRMNSLNEAEGIVELSHSRRVDLKRTKKIMGLSAEYTFDDILGSSSAILEQKQYAREFANSPFNLLIIGESGVGKELFAQSVHNKSNRRKGPFVALNCASFPENLIESELFGYVGGAFTGASKAGQISKFELAEGGTLFLDEIGELPLPFQSKLLRVLETRMVTRIGSSMPTPFDVRIIAATNRNLEKMVAEGLFRQDLYYRLHVLKLEIPPLRSRKEDVILLAESFLQQAGEMYGNISKILSPEARQIIAEYNWPGNIRELKNVMNRVTALSKRDIISRDEMYNAVYSKGYMLQENICSSDSGHLSSAIDSTAGLSPEYRIQHRTQAVSDSYAALLREALEITNGNKKNAAELLGISRMTFYRMLEKYIGESE